MKKLTTDQFITNAKKIHGDKYNYSLIEYKSNRIKVKIICKKHGVFEQIPEHHLKNSGCPKCYGNNIKTTKDFIIDGKNIHGDKYDYSLVEYVSNKTKVKIICKKHGIFEQIPTNHIYLKNGCPICKESHGENEIRTILENNNLKYIPQKTFSDLKNIKLCRYDGRSWRVLKNRLFFFLFFITK